jgi:hypothetical protein
MINNLLTTLRDDSVTTTAAGATVTAVANAGSVTTPPSTAPTLVPAPNALRSYASYNPVLSLLVTTPAKYGKLNDTPFLGFNTTDWQVICKSGGVGPNKAQGIDESTGNFVEGGTQYFSRDLYIESATVETLCGMSHENRGSNATNVEFTIVEPYGMDLIEQLYDYCNDGLLEKNYCQIPYMLKIEFKGFLDDGTNQTIPYTTKYIPIRLASMDIKVTNMGAIYKITAFAFNELGNTESYGRVPTDIQIGTMDAFIKEAGQAASAGVNVVAVNTKNGVQNQIYVSQGDKSGITQTMEADGTIADTITLSQLGSPNPSMKDITDALVAVLNRIQQNLLKSPGDNKPAPQAIADTYNIAYSKVPSTNNGTIDSAKFIQFSNLIPPSAKDTNMQANYVNKDNSVDTKKYAQHMASFLPNAQGETPAGVTYGDSLITFSSGSSIIDCLNTLFVNSDYIVAQIRKYNQCVDDVNKAVVSTNYQTGTPVPQSLQEALDKLKYTTLDWFIIIPSVSMGKYDGIRRIYAHNITYTIQPYPVFNSRSISAPNNDPLANNRVVKTYDYIFTGKNTEILNFDLNFSNAFFTYAQFNQNSKGMGTGANAPAGQPPGTVAPTSQVSLQAKSTVTVNGQYIQPSPSSPNAYSGMGAQTPERVQAADVAATIYAPGEQISLDMTIYGDPDFIRQDGVFLPTTSSDAYLNPTSPINIQGILFNSGEIYTNVNFKIPQDINSTTGLLDLAFDANDTSVTSKYYRNVFSGYFRVSNVTNKFDKGLFTQQLHMFRYVPTHDLDATNTTTQGQSTVVSNAGGTSTTPTPADIALASSSATTATVPANPTAYKNAAINAVKNTPILFFP